MTTVQNSTAAVSQDLMNAVNAKKATADGVQADQDKFMTLLVTQLKNQDPLNPMDNAEITSQLAQLSTVTGVNKLNSTLETLKSSYQSSESLAAANMIGHGVLVEGNFATLSSSKAIMGVELASPADSVQVIVTDPRTGKDITSIDLGPQSAGSVPLSWDGVADSSELGADGKPVPVKDGKYSFRVVATRGGEQLTDAKALAFDVVNSVTTSAKDGVKLNLPTKGVVSMADVKQIL
ncbi:MAG: flagellar hook assembly protein FlgD [Gammaproteobacteria bacterium]